MSEYLISLKCEASDVLAAQEECKRELGVRRGVYPRWIQTGKIAQSVADERIHRLELAERILKKVLTTMHVPYQPMMDFSGGNTNKEADHASTN